MIKLIIYLAVIILISTGAYFYGFNQGREKEILDQTSRLVGLTQDSIVSKKNLTTNSNSQNKAETKASFNPSSDDSSNKNEGTANGFDEYIVQEKDTLFTIGLKFDILWTHIALANNIDENTPLFIGQKLKIPTSESEEKNQNKEQTKIYQIDQVAAQEEQNKVNKDGSDLWRRDPVEVIRHEVLVDYDLSPGDPYTLVASDQEKGTATVFLQKEDKSFTFLLIQPIEKGENGIWKIEKIVITNISQ